MGWRTSEFLATWTWAFPSGALGDPAARARWLAEAVARALEALDGFAVAREATVCTAEDGEDAFAADLAADGAAALLSFLERTPDVETVELALALACSAPGGGELRVDDGAALVFDVELDTDGELARDPLACQLRFALHVDLYSPESRGAAPDRALAALNGPRLRGFLERLERLLPLRFLELEASGYSGAHRYGFA
jgi:hypothetical protein